MITVTGRVSASTSIARLVHCPSKSHSLMVYSYIRISSEHMKQVVNGTVSCLGRFRFCLRLLPLLHFLAGLVLLQRLLNTTLSFLSSCPSLRSLNRNVCSKPLLFARALLSLLFLSFLVTLAECSHGRFEECAVSCVELIKVLRCDLYAGGIVRLLLFAPRGLVKLTCVDILTCFPFVARTRHGYSSPSESEVILTSPPSLDTISVPLSKSVVFRCRSRQTHVAYELAILFLYLSKLQTEQPTVRRTRCDAIRLFPGTDGIICVRYCCPPIAWTVCKVVSCKLYMVDYISMFLDEE